MIDTVEEKGIAYLKRILKYIETQNFNSFSKDKMRKEFIRNMLPYCIQRFNDSYILLNREYKPLGVWGYSDFVNNEDYPYCMISDNRGISYFYDDFTNPNNSKFCFDTYFRNLKHFINNEQKNYITTIDDEKIRANQFYKATKCNVPYVEKNQFLFIR